ncbi:hypothetical protein DFH06DRAFT_1216614 [Mycena polygramma]|nr:hypothetical protein DFH06DRAFT_1216614 [Mycena polygramma]
MDGECDVTELVRADHLWFEDGGIIVKAQMTLFRLSRGVLVAQSPIFEDVFSLPQPPDAETMDECAVVTIPDAAQDATVFFRAIFDSSFFEAYPASTTLEILAGVLRLSDKYEVQHLRRRALVHLSSQFPTKLEDWDLLSSTSAWMRRSWDLDDEPGTLIQLIKLSRESRAPWILPTVLYHLGNTVGNDETHLPTILHGEQRLDNADQVSFLIGYGIQRNADRDVTRFLYDPTTIPGCSSRTQCMESRFHALTDVADDCNVNPTIPLSIWAEGDWGRLCTVCLRALRKSHRGARQDLWARIPHMYGLASWEELEELKEAAIGRQ